VWKRQLCRAHIRRLTDAGSIPAFATWERLLEKKELFMYTVYVLYSVAFDKIYIGYTSDLEDRFKSHNELGTKGWTIRFRPWTILHTENFDSKSSAMKREKQLKSAMGRAFIKEMVQKRYST
jgi:putative endonuclease